MALLQGWHIPIQVRQTSIHRFRVDAWVIDPMNIQSLGEAMEWVTLDQNQLEAQSLLI